MAVQQTRSSKRKCRQRRAANRYKGLQTRPCPRCGAFTMPHRICPDCGYYNAKIDLPPKEEA